MLRVLHDYLDAWRPTAHALAEAVCVVDRKGCIQFANDSFQRMLGCAETDLVERRVIDISQCAPFFSPNAFDAASEQELTACEWRRVNGHAVVGRCSVRPILFRGEPVGSTLIVPAADAFAEPDPRIDADTARHAFAAEAAKAERRVRVLESVGDIALSQLPLDDLLQALLDGMYAEMGLENVAFFLIDEDGQRLTAHGSSGAGAHMRDRVHFPVDKGLMGEVIVSRRTRYVPDIRQVIQESPYIPDELRAVMDLYSAVFVPLMVDQRVIGLLYVGAREPDRFAPEDVRLIELVAIRAALAIERARANDAAVCAHERLRLLNDASGSLNATLDYRATTKRLADLLTPNLSDACAVYLLGDDGQLSKVETRSSGDPNDLLTQMVERLDATVEAVSDSEIAVGRSVRLLRPIFERKPLTGDGADTEQPGYWCLCAPLVVRMHALGAIYLARRPEHEFSDGDIALVLGLAERAAVAIDNARLFIETQEALAIGSEMATQLDTIINSTDVGIFVTDATGDEMRVNPYGAHLLGLPREGTARRSDFPDVPFEIRTTDGEPIPLEREPLYFARVEGRPVEARFVIHRRDTGKDIQALTRCTPWFDSQNKIAGAIAVVTDITEILELERQKDEFVGIASHELKTPLTTLKILAQLLARRLEASGESQEAEQARRMQVSITRMERLINDLLDVSLIREGQLPLQLATTDLVEVCAEVIGEQELLSHRHIRFSAPTHERMLVQADRERIYQVLTNLLSNAIKYSPATEPVIVRARVTDTECIVTVHDHGPGVPAEAVGHIFDRFYRVPVMQVQSGSGFGLGLGLHISKEIIDRHGGRLWVESKLGHGSEFSFALPRVDAPPEDTQA